MNSPCEVHCHWFTEQVMRYRDLATSGMLLLVGTLLVSSQVPRSPAREPEANPARFPIPIWHADARWEVEPHFVGSSAPGFLDGPRQQSQPYARSVDLLYGPTSGGRNWLLSYEPATEMMHIVAGSARGFLDGPFSRARFGTNSYNSRPSMVPTADRRYYYLHDAENMALRRCDLQRQEVVTIRRPVKAFGGHTVNDQGQVLVIEDETLLWLNSDGQEQKRLRLQVPERLAGIGNQGASLALDDVHDRLYATSFNPRQWYIWYWDLKDGSVHGVIPVSPKGQGRKRNEAGPFTGTDLYMEGTVFFGPDDPQKRFLYTARVDTFGFFRLDLEKQHLSALTVESRKGQPDVARFIDAGVPRSVPVYFSAKFTEDGSIISSAHHWEGLSYVATRLKRIK